MGETTAEFCRIHNMKMGDCADLHQRRHDLSALELFVLNGLREWTIGKLELVVGKDQVEVDRLIDLLSCIEDELKRHEKARIITI